MLKMFMVAHAQSHSGTKGQITNGDAVTHDVTKAANQINAEIARQAALRGGNTGTGGTRRG